MNIDLLGYSLERISSLHNFYLLEKEPIRTKAVEGMKKNCFGFMAEQYFSRLVMPIKDEGEEVENLKERLGNYIEIVKSDSQNKSVLYRIKSADSLREKGYELDFAKASLNYHQFMEMPVIHGNNTLIMLITRFEEFISNFLSNLYALYPEKYLDNQTVTFSEINKTTIEEVKHFIISREVDMTMRDSYKAWFKILESHKLKFTEYADEIKILEELYARRNIVVHNSGRVNSSYLKQIKDSTYKNGELLIVDEEYLKRAFKAIEGIIFAIMIEAVKLTPQDKLEYHKDIFKLAYTKLSDGNYTLCSKIFKSLSKSKYLSEEYRLMSQVNYWISIKETEGLEAIIKEVLAFDTSALNELFTMAKYILSENYDEALNVIEDVYEKEIIDSNIIENWPLFKWFRESEYFQQFKDKHSEDFNVATFEVEQEANTSTEADVEICDKKLDVEECCV